MTTENGSRLDRIERILERNAEQIAALAERQERTEQNIDHLAEITDRLIARNAELIARNAEQIARNDKQIARNDKQIARNDKQIAALAQEMGFLRAGVQGPITQSTPPAHEE